MGGVGGARGVSGSWLARCMHHTCMLQGCPPSKCLCPSRIPLLASNACRCGCGPPYRACASCDACASSSFCAPSPSSPSSCALPCPCPYLSSSSCCRRRRPAGACRPCGECNRSKQEGSLFSWLRHWAVELPARAHRNPSTGKHRLSSDADDVAAWGGSAYSTCTFDSLYRQTQAILRRRYSCNRQPALWQRQRLTSLPPAAAGCAAASSRRCSQSKWSAFLSTERFMASARPLANSARVSLATCVWARRAGGEGGGRQGGGVGRDSGAGGGCRRRESVVCDICASSSSVSPLGQQQGSVSTGLMSIGVRSAP